MKKFNISNPNKAFTLVEILIVVAIIALLATLAIPSALRARKTSQASVVLDDLRVIDAGISQYALDNNLTSGAAVGWTNLQAYIKYGSRLYSSNNTDILGNPFNNAAAPGGYVVDTPPAVNTKTFNALSDVAPSTYWKEFYSPSAAP